MSEIYSLGERILIFSIISIFSIVSSLVYLFCRIERKKTTVFIFLLCLLYSSLFVFLNIIAMFDLIFSQQKGFEKFSKVILKYYEIFDYIDKILGYIIFPIIIYYLESGHYSFFRKLLDGIFGALCDLYKTLILSFRIILFGVLLALLIIYRKHFGLNNNPIDYFFIILDCYAVIDIYICVGFFMAQVGEDYKRIKKENLIKRYYRYSVTKIIQKAENYINKMHHLYEVLNKEIQDYKKDKSSSYYKFLENTLHKIDEKLKAYESQSKGVNDKNNINNFYPLSTERNLKSNDNNLDVLNNIQNLKNPNDKNDQSEINKDKRVENQNEKIKEKEKKKKEDPFTCKKNFKKYVRRIDKLKKLYKEIEKEKENDLENIGNNKKGTCGDFFLAIAFIIEVVTDFILPIVLDSEEDYIDEDDKYEKEKSMFGLAVAVIIAILFSVVWNSYTIITIYSTKRRRYISGDFLYDKQINDNLSLLKSVQLICGFSFSLVYCNLYFWKTLDKKKVFGKPHYYQKIIIPDYTIKNGISVYMIVKIIIIIVSIIAALKYTSNKISVFKNDLAEYNSICGDSKYDQDNELYKIIAEKQDIYNILRNN